MSCRLPLLTTTLRRDVGDAAIPEYRHTSAAWEVSDIVFCEVSAANDDWLKESQWVQSLADGPFKDSQPRIGAIMAQTPPGFGTSPVSNYSAKLDELQAKVPLVRGVRTELAEHTPDKLAGLEELGRRNLVVDFLSDIVTGIPFQIIRDTPTVKYQIEHLGCGCGVAALYANQTKYKQWQAAIKQLATLPNIQALQVGGTMAGFKSKEKVDAATIKPFVQTVVKEFGFNRLVFEANWFFCNFLPAGPDKGMDGYGTWAKVLVPMLTELGATPQDLKQLFRTNALRAYGINATHQVPGGKGIYSNAVQPQS